MRKMRGVVVAWMVVAVVPVVAACGFGGGMTTMTTMPPAVPNCAGGTRLVAGQCYCAAGMAWNGLACQGTPSAGTCGGGGYPFGPAGGEQCFCLDGYMIADGTCVALQCSGGAVAGVDQCVCPDGTSWDGAQCATIAQVPATPQCTGGAMASGDQCVCPDGTSWDGAQCAVAAPDLSATTTSSTDAGGDEDARPHGRHRESCRAAVIRKGLDPSWASRCEGVEDRCAVAVLERNLDPSWLPSCQGVNGRCAEAVMQHGLDPSWLSTCKGVDGRCAAAFLDRNIDPSWISRCQGVDGKCVEALMQQGYDPSHVSDCAR
jgi:hypothetical protein